MDEIVEQYYKLFMKVLGNDQVAYPVYSWSNYIRRCLYKIVGLNRAGVFNESFVNYLSVNSCTLKMSLEAFCDGTESDYFKEVYNYFDSSYAVFSNYYDKETGLDSCDFPFIKTLSDQMREVIIKSGLTIRSISEKISSYREYELMKRAVFCLSVRCYINNEFNGFNELMNKVNDNAVDILDDIRFNGITKDNIIENEERLFNRVNGLFDNKITIV